LSEYPRIQDAATPVLFHPDLHKRNIFVSDDNPSFITSIIDWQSASIEPAFWYTDETPDFALPDVTSQDSEKVDESSEVCGKAFDACLQFLVPKLAKPRLMDDSFFRPF